jgi:hypothetical protein
MGFVHAKGGSEKGREGFMGDLKHVSRMGRVEKGENGREKECKSSCKIFGRIVYYLLCTVCVTFSYINRKTRMKSYHASNWG